MHPLRRFLYISPYFPPAAKVGALRPLKFARHLPPLGWAPVVLADLAPGPLDPELLPLVPPSAVVVRDYSRKAGRRHRALLRSTWDRQRSIPEGEAERREPLGPEGWLAELGSRLSALPRMAEAGSLAALLRPVRELLAGFENPELLTLGPHVADIPHALGAGRRLLQRYRCEAILVNADPYAAMLVGRELSRETGLPLVLDLRDPWAPCELRRPLRPLPQRELADYLERLAVSAAARVILNTENAREAYLTHYPDLPAGRFCTIRNHADPSLFDKPGEPCGSEFLLLLLGNLRRFVSGNALLEALAEVSRRDLGGQRVRLKVVGAAPREARELALDLGVEQCIQWCAPTSYRRVGALMHGADLLVSISHPGLQRIPAKTFDYLTSHRPILSVTDNPELTHILDQAGGARVHSLDDVPGIAASIVEEVRLGRRRRVDRRDVGASSAAASAKLARILEEVVQEGPP